MVAQSLCPDPDVIRNLLLGDLPEDEYEDLSSHFDLCSDCRQTFEAEASDPDFLGDAARLCIEESWEQETAALEQLVRDMPSQLSSVAEAASTESWSTESVADFLEPSENEEHLGRLGSHEIVEVIGQGGMGVVLHGIDEKLNRVVAIKVLAPHLASNPNARRRFFREGQAAAAVSHDHVVTIHAVDDAERLPYLVMEFVKGESLEECIRRTGQLPLEAVLRMGRQMALGLAAAHEVGLVHRDMKPANILLENGIQRVRITDFGLARAVDDVAITQSGVVSGTPLYMSPEQAGGETVDHRSDLFSLGSILYTMCTGRPAFRAQSTLAVLKRVAEETPRPIREINPDVPEWLAAIIDRLLAKQPDERFQSAVEVAELLGGHLAHLQDPLNVAAPAPVAEPARPVSRLRRLMFVMLLAVAVLGVTEASGVTKLTEFLGIVLKLKTPDGTLIVEIEDPNVKVSVDGDEVVIEGIGKHELRLKPGKHKWTTNRNGTPGGTEWVTIESGGKVAVRVKQLPPTGGAGTRGNPSPFPEYTPKPGDPGYVYRPSADGMVFTRIMGIKRFLPGSVMSLRPLGKLIFNDVPEQLYGQNYGFATDGDGQLDFKVVPRTFGEWQWVPRHGGTTRQRVWLLVPEKNWKPDQEGDEFWIDDRKDLKKKGWTEWRTLTSHHVLTDPEIEENQIKWVVFYRDCEGNENHVVRTHPDHTPMLVWGSTNLDGIIVDVQWDQGVSVFKDGATVPLGNGFHRFEEVPEFLDGRLFTRRNGYQGITRFKVERDQRVTIGLYDWEYMYDGNASGGWLEELTSPEGLRQQGWLERGTLKGWHSNSKLGGNSWHFYSRDCKRGEQFAIRNHKY